MRESTIFVLVDGSLNVSILREVLEPARKKV